jgi:hypothetical protein
VAGPADNGEQDSVTVHRCRSRSNPHSAEPDHLHRGKQLIIEGGVRLAAKNSVAAILRYPLWPRVLK